MSSSAEESAEEEPRGRISSSVEEKWASSVEEKLAFSVEEKSTSSAEEKQTLEGKLRGKTSSSVEEELRGRTSSSVRGNAEENFFLCRGNA